MRRIERSGGDDGEPVRSPPGRLEDSPAGHGRCPGHVDRGRAGFVVRPAPPPLLCAGHRLSLLKGTKSITQVDPSAYDAIFLAGGQSPMITMIDDTALHTFVAKAYEAGKIVGVVCHGTCILLNTKLSNGDLLVTGKT